MIWAIETDNGYVIRYCSQHPEKEGHYEECQGRRVVQLLEEPTQGLEVVDFNSGKLIFKPDLSIYITKIKNAASEHINKVAPIWKQLNDLADPNSDGSLRASIDYIRNWSNNMEARLHNVKSKQELEALLKEVDNGIF